MVKRHALSRETKRTGKRQNGERTRICHKVFLSFVGTVRGRGDGVVAWGVPGGYELLTAKIPTHGETPCARDPIALVPSITEWRGAYRETARDQWGKARLRQRGCPPIPACSHYPTRPPHHIKVSGPRGWRGWRSLPPPFVDPNLGGRRVGQSAAGLATGGGGGGYPNIHTSK